jgi:hypothetical protein
MGKAHAAREDQKIGRFAQHCPDERGLAADARAWSHILQISLTQLSGTRVVGESKCRSAALVGDVPPVGHTPRRSKRVVVSGWPLRHR